MTRNIVLAVSSLAVLILLFLGYTALVGTPGADAGRPSGPTLPPPPEPAGEPLRIGDTLEMPPGGKIMFRRYDERTGRPRDMFLCQDWRPVPESKNEIRVSGPELAMLLPGGMTVIVTADEGQILVDRVEQAQMRPKTGWLAGHVRIVADRGAGPDRPPRDERPEDLITVTVERLQFDLDLGELQTDERLTVQSDDFEIAGTGLHLIWSPGENRIETLTIRQGERFVLYGVAGLFGEVTGSAAQREEAGPASTAPAARPSRRHAQRPPTAYACVLDGGLVAEQWRGDRLVGGLTADEVRLLFDVGGGASRVLRAAAPTTAPASRPARDERERLVLRWTGSLRLEPAPPDPRATANRRRFEAVGNPVVLTRQDAVLRCGRVAFHDDTQRVWLYPTAAGRVQFDLGPNLSAAAGSIFVDQGARVVKLIGDVELRSQRGGGERGRTSFIRSAHWAELHLAQRAATTAPASDLGLPADRLESAMFVGDVEVDLGGQKLAAHRLDVGFRPAEGGQSLEEALDTALASGAVRLSAGDGRLSAAELRLTFARTPAGELYPSRMAAAGAAVVQRDRARIRGGQIVASTAPPPPSTPAAKKPAFVLQELQVRGEAELVDPDNRVGARGDEIAADFEGLNRLARARVSGGPRAPGLLRAEPYTVRGEQINLDRRALTLHVEGPSRLAFKTQRSLQGRQRRQPTPIIVTSRDRLHIDGRRNTVYLAGEVDARTEREHLYADTLTLLLEDVTPPPSARPAASWAGLCRELFGSVVRLGGLPTAASWRAVWREGRGLWNAAPRPTTPDEPLAWQLSDEGERLRKEPVRLHAEGAVVTSETVEPGHDGPTLEASVRAPRLEVDIVNRQIVTSGLTQLLMLDRRGADEAASASPDVGLPSALLSRGPSQTAMQCTGQMTYTLGPDGPGRRDTAVFEDDVFFVHRTGREMVQLDHMLPQLASAPELLDSLKSRHTSLECDRLECWFSGDGPGSASPVGGALTEASLRLSSMLASGSVYLRDQEGPRIREVNAGWIEFSRELGRIHVRGAAPADARVYFEDTQRAHFDVHAGRELTINLNDGTIRSETMAGEMRR